MPDRDNLSRSLPKGWGGAYGAARKGPEFLAKYLAHITSKELCESSGLEFLEPLTQQLSQLVQLSLEGRSVATLEPPANSELIREGLLALHAAERVLAEMLTSPDQPKSVKEVRERLCKEFCIEIPRVYCLGVLSVRGVPDIYRDVTEAQKELRACEELLRDELKTTAKELAKNPSKPEITRIRRPKYQKPSQPELVSTSLGGRVNRSAIGLDPEENDD